MLVVALGCSTREASDGGSDNGGEETDGGSETSDGAAPLEVCTDLDAVPCDENEACFYDGSFGCIPAVCAFGRPGCDCDVDESECGRRSWCVEVFGEIVEGSGEAACLTGESVYLHCIPVLPGCDDDAQYLCDGSVQVFVPEFTCPPSDWGECAQELASAEPPPRCE